MVKVTNLSIIREEHSYVLFFQTEEGDCSIMISKSDYLRMEEAFAHKSSVLGQIVRDTAIHVESCRIIWNGKLTIAKFYTKDRVYESVLQDILPVAVELNLPIYIDSNLLERDYGFDIEHEEQVRIMVEEELIYWKSKKIETLMYEIQNAIADERYEEAAILRDQIDLINKASDER